MILYGSFAKGNPHEDSDIDICVISNEWGKKFDSLSGFLWEKVVGIDPRIEPVGYHPSDFVKEDPLAYEIMKYGIEI